MTSTKFVGELYRAGAFFEAREFSDSIIRIGSVGASDWRIEGAAARQLVLLHDRVCDRWEAVPMVEGVTLNCSPLRDLRPLASAGEITFGECVIQFKIVRLDHPLAKETEELDSTRCAQVLAQWAEQARKAELEDPAHHEQLARNLVEEIRRAVSTTVDMSSYDNILKQWTSATFPFRRKVRALRVLLRVIREIRSSNARTRSALIESTISLGEDGIRTIFSMAPAEALRRARDVLVRMVSAQQALDLLKALNLQEQLSKIDGPLVSKEATNRGFDELVSMLESDVDSGVALLTLYVSRAGGYTLSEEENQKLHAAFEAVHSTQAI